MTFLAAPSKKTSFQRAFLGSFLGVFLCILDVSARHHGSCEPMQHVAEGAAINVWKGDISEKHRGTTSPAATSATAADPRKIALIAVYGKNEHDNQQARFVIPTRNSKQCHPLRTSTPDPTSARLRLGCAAFGSEAAARLQPKVLVSAGRTNYSTVFFASMCCMDLAI